MVCRLLPEIWTSVVEVTVNVAKLAEGAHVAEATLLTRNTLAIVDRSAADVDTGIEPLHECMLLVVLGGTCTTMLLELGTFVESNAGAEVNTMKRLLTCVVPEQIAYEVVVVVAAGNPPDNRLELVKVTAALPPLLKDTPKGTRLPLPSSQLTTWLGPLVVLV